jgi:hydroxypyruvate reductase
MARAAEDVLGPALSESLAVDSSDRIPLARTRRIVAGHPVPDESGRRAADEVEALARGLGRDDLLLLLISGGASALLPAPADGLALADKAQTASVLMRAGATIHELNTVRKHLSRLKGGGLARAAAPAQVACLALSDVIGDDPSTIASGPVSPDPTTFAAALDVAPAPRHEAVPRRRGGS